MDTHAYWSRVPSIILLDDWRFSESVLTISQQLLLLEAAPICVSRPQNQHKGHGIWSGSSPVFITTLEADLMRTKGVLPGDVAMLHKRLRVYRFTQVLTNPDASLVRCAACFSKFILKKGIGQPGRSLGALPEWLEELLQSPSLRELFNRLPPHPQSNAV